MAFFNESKNDCHEDRLQRQPETQYSSEKEDKKLERYLLIAFLFLTAWQMIPAIFFKNSKVFTCQEQREFIRINPQTLLFMDMPDCKDSL